MRTIEGWVAVALGLVFVSGAVLAGEVRWWVSTEGEGGLRLAEREPLSWEAGGAGAGQVIELDEGQEYQSLVGLGNSLDHSTCYNLGRLSKLRRDEVLRSVLEVENGIGVSLMRICFGTPDFTASPWYSYDDLGKGEIDPGMERFSIERDREYVLPVLKRALEIQPDLKFIASVWSPPAWMKSNDNLCGGRIRREHFEAFALYLAKSVEAYRAEGIPVYALTPQNEPEYNPDTYPTCGWRAEEQRDFVRDHLGPMFEKRGIRTRIWVYDHNFDHPQFPLAILDDPAAARYVDGTAWHHYVGEPAAMTEVHRRYPDKGVYFTEGSTFGVEGAAQIVSFLRNWARSYAAWVTMIDDDLGPNPGPHDCSPTSLFLKRDTLEVEYRFDYFMYGQFSKFIRPEAVRFASTQGGGLSTVAFRNEDGGRVLVVVNPGETGRVIRVLAGDRSFEVPLGGRSLATFVW